MNPSSLITIHHLDCFQHDGVLHLPAVISPEDAHRLFLAFQEHIGPNPETNAYGVLRNNIWEKISVFEELLRHSVLPNIAMDILQTDRLICFQDNVICKTPGTLDQVEWHQDFSYWPLDRPHGITLWVALTDAAPETGCMSFIPGSHLLGEKCPTNFVPNSNQPLRPDLPPLDLSLAPNPARVYPARIGDVVAHHPLAWHMSPGNHSERWRCAWSITFIQTDVRWSPKHAPHPFVLTEGPSEGDPIQGDLFPDFAHGLH